MRILPAAGAALLLSTVCSNAAVLDLSYLVTMQSESGWISDKTFEIAVDTDKPHNLTGFEVLNGYTNFDLATGAISIYWAEGTEDQQVLDLLTDGTGEYSEVYSENVFPFEVTYMASYDVLSFEVDGLPMVSDEDVSPVPLPASLPLLAVGLGAIALFRRRA